jgi:outer membrane protein OmpA-like peptidoglycan-associated protein
VEVLAKTKDSTNVTYRPRLYLVMILLLLLPLEMVSQTGSYTVTLAPFSSEIYDEFSPVYYKNGIVFCTNRSTGMSSYTDSKNKSPFSICYVDTTNKYNWRSAILFSKDIESVLNDGPASFSSTGDTIWFSRNQHTDLKINKMLGSRNKLGIYSAVRTGGKWNNTKEFRYNIEWYNVTTPCLSPDGKRLYFASDQPGGAGGLDLYYSQWRNGYWDTPVNLGPTVNTPGNESYPFINSAGELFFASDGHKGMGGKDIFVTKQRGSGWYMPLRLDEPINTEYDDFGIITDAMMHEGYFSSSRGKTVDIYQFKSNKFQFWFSEPQKSDKYCFSVTDTGSISVDSTRFGFVWSFGDGTRAEGRTSSHCYAGPGMYNVSLDLYDIYTGKPFFKKLAFDVEVREIDQPFINSPDVIVSGEMVSFDGLKSYSPGYTPVAYYWDFGDGYQGIGEKVSHNYGRSGKIEVKMGLVLKSQANGENIKRVVSKKILIAGNIQEKASLAKAASVSGKEIPDIHRISNIRITGMYSAEADFRKESMFQVVIATSKTKIPVSTFKKVPAKYIVREIQDEAAGTFAYVADEQMDLASAYPAYQEMVASGYPEAMVRLYVLKSAAEKQLFGIRKKYGLLTENYFDGNRLLTNAILMLNSVVSLMNGHPDIKLEIGMHSDNQGVASNNQWQTQARAQAMVDYLVSSGIKADRLRAKGYAATKPVASNQSVTGRRLNRRVELVMIN